MQNGSLFLMTGSYSLFVVLIFFYYPLSCFSNFCLNVLLDLQLHFKCFEFLHERYW